MGKEKESGEERRRGVRGVNKAEKHRTSGRDKVRGRDVYIDKF